MERNLKEPCLICGSKFQRMKMTLVSNKPRTLVCKSCGVKIIKLAVKQIYEDAGKQYKRDMELQAIREKNLKKN